MPDKVYDSPKGWVAQHINDYVKSNGKKGHIWRGVPTLFLTTRGRKTGNLRRTALIYGRNGASYVVVGSGGGAAHHPNWYLNLTADSNVEVQVGSEVMPGLARTADESERQRLLAADG